MHFLNDVLPLSMFSPAPGPKCMKSTLLHVLISQEEAWPSIWSSDEVVLGRGELFFLASLVLTAGELTLAPAPSSQPLCHCNTLMRPVIAVIALSCRGSGGERGGWVGEWVLVDKERERERDRANPGTGVCCCAGAY